MQKLNRTCTPSGPVSILAVVQHLYGEVTNRFAQNSGYRVAIMPNFNTIAHRMFYSCFISANAWPIKDSRKNHVSFPTPTFSSLFHLFVLSSVFPLLSSVSLTFIYSLAPSFHYSNTFIPSSPPVLPSVFSPAFLYVHPVLISLPIF